MAISEYDRLQLEQRKINDRLDQIASNRAKATYAKSELLKGSISRITSLSFEASLEIEKKYTEIYGENWRERLSSKEVEQIEEIIAIEKRNAREEIEGTTLRTKLGGRSRIKRR